MEAQECLAMGRWLDLVSLMLTSADLIFSRVSEKGIIAVIRCTVLGLSYLSCLYLAIWYYIVVDKIIYVGYISYDSFARTK